MKILQFLLKNIIILFYVRKSLKESFTNDIRCKGVVGIPTKVSLQIYKAREMRKQCE